MHSGPSLSVRLLHHLRSLSQQDELLSLVREHRHQVFLLVQLHHLATREMIRCPEALHGWARPGLHRCLPWDQFLWPEEGCFPLSRHTRQRHQPTASLAEDLYPLKAWDCQNKNNLHPVGSLSELAGSTSDHEIQVTPLGQCSLIHRIMTCSLPMATGPNRSPSSQGSWSKPEAAGSHLVESKRN